MDLWIRSQDKMNLVKVRQVSVNYQNSKQIIANYTPELFENSGEFFELLGTYKTKERALEVLDEIHNCILDKNVLNICNNLLTLANKNTINEVNQIISRAEKIAVYEMPKE